MNIIYVIMYVQYRRFDVVKMFCYIYILKHFTIMTFKKINFGNMFVLRKLWITFDII